MAVVVKVAEGSETAAVVAAFVAEGTEVKLGVFADGGVTGVVVFGDKVATSVELAALVANGAVVSLTET